MKDYPHYNLNVLGSTDIVTTTSLSMSAMKILFSLSPLLLLSYSLNTHALSASTANTIQGTKPYFMLNGNKVNNTDELVGFSFPDSSEPENIRKIDITQSLGVSTSNVVLIPAGLKENEIEALVAFSNPLVATNLDTLVKTESHPLKIADSDGDAADLINTSANGTISAVMRKNAAIITPSSNPINPCSDYLVAIKITKSGTPLGITAITAYGDPNNSEDDYTTKTGNTTNVIYRLFTPAICYLAPESLDVVASPENIIDGISYPSNVGYTSLWEGSNASNSKGFKVSEMVSSGNKFPQTGFKGAKFTVTGSGTSQSNYECVVTPATGIIQSPATATNSVGKNCTIEYTSIAKPTSGMTITLKYLDTVVDTYTTPTPQLWAKIYNETPYNTAADFSGTYPAADLCAGSSTGLSGNSAATQTAAASYFFKRSELSNARNATVPVDRWDSLHEYYIRDVSVTSPSIMGEWGSLSGNYTNSGFSSDSYIWTSDTLSTQSILLVDNTYGRIEKSVPTISYLTMCR